jgi:hypothetical protein
MATEEIEWLDEELTNGYTELDAKVKELRSSAGKKLSKGARDDKVRCFCLCIQLACLAANTPPSSARLCLLLSCTEGTRKVRKEVKRKVEN